MKKLMTLVLMSLFAIACDKRANPVGATDVQEPPIVSFQVTSVDGAPVPGANVWIWGFDTFVTDGSGTVRLPAGAVPLAEADMTISAPNFQERLTRYGKGGPFTILPFREEAGAEYFQEIIFGEYSPGGKLTRVMAKTASVLFGQGIEGRSDREEAVRLATSVMNEGAGGGVRFTNEPGGEITFIVEVNPGDPYASYGLALAYRKLSGNTIIGGTIVVTNPSYDIKQMVTHELGHMLGFSHSGHAGDRMNPYLDRGGEFFSWKERLAAAYLLQRGSGTSYPDNDRAAAATAASVTRDVIVCR